MTGTKLRKVAVLAVTLTFLGGALMIPMITDNSHAASESVNRPKGSTFSEAFSLKLLDSDGNDLSDPLFGGETIVYFDTFGTPSGTVYKLKAMLSIKTIPASLVISSPGGLFKLAVAASNLGSFLETTGIRITISNGSNDYTADMNSNDTSAEFMNGPNIAALEPNLEYSVKFNLINEYDSTVAPEKVENIRFTFQAIASDGFHQVIFISQDETIESYVAFDNYVIEKVPSVSRSGYSFQGWYTLDKKEITDGYVITSSDMDIIAYAEWEKDGSNTALYIGIGGGGTGLLFLLLLLILLKRRNSEESS